MHTVRINGDRPDFRVFIDLFHGRGRNVDTDGDSVPVDSRKWTELYIKDRESDEPPVSVHPDDADPNLFIVSSESDSAEELVALYLYIYCGVAMTRDLVAIDQQEIEALKSIYSHELARAESSGWHRASDRRPNPSVA